jgi:hypothetical protein
MYVCTFVHLQVGSILNAIKRMSWEPAIFFAFSRKVSGDPVGEGMEHAWFILA